MNQIERILGKFIMNVPSLPLMVSKVEATEEPGGMGSVLGRMVDLIVYAKYRM